MFKTVHKKVDDGCAYYGIELDNSEIRITLLNDHVFRLQVDPYKLFLPHPTPHDVEHTAKMLVRDVAKIQTAVGEMSETNNEVIISTTKITIVYDKALNLFKVFNNNDNCVMLEEVKPIMFSNGCSIQTFQTKSDEYFYGGGTQNGRFLLNEETIYILNTNQWDDGGVASPNPFFWSTRGYGVLRHTWMPGIYNFNSQNDVCETSHETNDFDAFYFINDQPVDILRAYYDLTGKPLLIPEYAYYESHLNAYNRDYWVEVSEEEGIRFEDKKFYKEYKPDDTRSQGGVLESINGENNNYQFSARAVVDRYKSNDMPLGWFIPNDGYGAGYGQTKSFEGDIENLKEFVNYCEQNGVKVGLWTESHLHPDSTLYPEKGERDLLKEVEIAGIVALKTDVAWVGSGYSFGLNGIEDASKIFEQGTKGSVRPMIITVDGWAGTQRYSAVWTGDQTGGNWENIRFHIPTVIGTSLSGQPNVGADMDGIFGGRNKEVNIRDFQWKTFIPIQMNMDGWGLNPKTPFEFDEETADINRAYLKLKSTLMPYNYSIGFEATYGLPMIRLMALEFPLEKSAYIKDSQYQYMWGPSILIAPIYSDKKDSSGYSVRDGLYLPDPQQIWIDLFTGEKYRGGRIINNFKVPLWKLPVFIKDGAIIPLVNPNNNPDEMIRDERIIILYPNGISEFNIYEDDGLSTGYLKGEYVLTKIRCKGPKSNESGDLKISINKSQGAFKGFAPLKSIKLFIMSSRKPDTVKLVVNKEEHFLKSTDTLTDFNKSSNVFFYDETFVINKYLLAASGNKLALRCLLVKTDKIDTSLNDVHIYVGGFENRGPVRFEKTMIAPDLSFPGGIDAPHDRRSAYSLTINWLKVVNALSYEVERDGDIFTNITADLIEFENLLPLSSHSFRVRSVNQNGTSEWSPLIHATTNQDPYKNLINDITVVCNYPEQSNQELDHLTKNNNKIWHTHWTTGVADQNKGYITLNFNLGTVHHLSQVEYVPRSDAGNGTILELMYRISTDEANWSEYSETIKWDHNNDAKIINVNDKVQLIEVVILKSVGGFGSGRKMLFFKKDE